MFWTYLIIGLFSLTPVCALAEICSTFPTMGALYYWAYRLGGDDWGPYASWIAGWCNLLGQIAGVASGAYAGADVITGIITLMTGRMFKNAEILGFFALMLVIAAIVNSYAEVLLTSLCYISVTWQIIGTLVIVTCMFCLVPSTNSSAYVFTGYNNESGFTNPFYVALIGSLAGASIFTGYDTGAHVAEVNIETW